MFPDLFGAIGRFWGSERASTRFSEVTAFGSNPGDLRMHLCTPARVHPGAPLILVLHGCKQDATGFAADAGWVALSAKLRIPLVLPEQGFRNNQARCFNWFRPGDVARGKGEAHSIRQMLRHAAKRFGSDPRRVFVVGFSAGGSMAAALLAAYPEVFAAGAVVAGTPVGCAFSTVGALLQMHQPDTVRSPARLAADVRAVGRTPHRKVWPRLVIWQGKRDHTVDPRNADALAAQWVELHGVPASSDQPIGAARRRRWGTARAAAAVEYWTMEDLAHGYPVDPSHAEGGRAGAWVVDAGMSATWEIARFWGIAAS